MYKLDFNFILRIKKQDMFIQIDMSKSKSACKCFYQIHIYKGGKI